MSINTAHANNGVLIHSGEAILLFSDNVTMELGSNDAPILKGSKVGRIYLTTHRIIFNSKNMAKDELKSFSAPFVSLNDVKLEQPTFGANYIKGRIAAQENGGYVGEVSFKLTFKAGGAIDFGQAMLRASQMARQNARGYAPPPYEAPTGGWYQAPPPAYTPTAQSCGWLPSNPAFATGPDPNTVFMTDNPPPYPGVNSTGYPQGTGQQTGAAYQPTPPTYSQAAAPGYPTGYPAANGYPAGGYPGAAGYPQQQGYPNYPGGYQDPGYQGNSIYPNPYQATGVYPAAQPGYPAQYPNGNYGYNPPPPAYTPGDQKKSQ